MIGQRFGRLSVIAEAPAYREPSGKPRKRWLCRCDCGNESTPHEKSLKAGMSQSCGCRIVEATVARSLKHGQARFGRFPREYRAWRGVMARCSNVNGKSYADYGGRGIKVCERWLDYENFLADMGKCPSGLSLDRIDVNGNYEPGNCRWATFKEQMRNKRTNRWLVLASGERVTLAEAVERTGLTRGALWSRLKRGWPMEEALRTPRLAGRRP